jgi:hypothetical protein
MAVSLPVTGLRHGDIRHARTNWAQTLLVFSDFKESDATRQVNTATVFIDLLYDRE